MVRKSTTSLYKSLDREYGDSKLDEIASKLLRSISYVFGIETLPSDENQSTLIESLYANEGLCIKRAKTETNFRYQVAKDTMPINQTPNNAAKAVLSITR